MDQGKERSKNGKSRQLGSVLKASFDDFDAFAESVAAWELDFVQLDSGPFDASLIQVNRSESSLLKCSFARGLHQTGGLPTAARTFGIPLPGCLPFRWYRQLADDRSVMIFPKGGQLDSRTFPQFKVITFSLNEMRLKRIAEREDLEAVLDSGARATRPRSAMLDQIHQTAFRLVTLGITDAPQEICEDFRDDLEDELAVLLLEALDKELVLRSRPMAQERGRVLRAALSIISDRVSSPLRISQLCELTGASTRTLRYAFEQEFGLSPKTYIRARQMMHVRRRLQRADPGNSVKGIALENGFIHTGQFAADYRKMFGELPSTTLRQLR